MVWGRPLAWVAALLLLGVPVAALPEPTGQPDKAAAFAEVRAGIDRASGHASDGRYAEAEAEMQSAILLFRDAISATHPSLARLHHQLGLLRKTQGRLGVARESLEEAYRIQRHAAPDSPESREIAEDLVSILLDLDQASEAIEMLDAIAATRHDRDATFNATMARGTATLILGDYAAAVDHLEDAVTVARSFSQDLVPRMMRAYSLLTKARLAARDIEAARDTIARARAFLRALPDAAPAHLLDLEILEARARIALGAFESADDQLEATLAALETHGLADGALGASAHYNRGEIALMRGNFARAEAETLAALDRYVAITGWTHRIVGQIYLRLAIIYQEVGDHGGALDFYDKGEEIFRAALGDAHPSTLNLLNESTEALLAVGEVDEALARNETVGVGFRALGPRFRHQQGLAMARRGLILHDLGRDPRARPAFEQAVLLLEGDDGLGEIDMPRSLLGLAEIALDQGDMDGARAHAERAIGILTRMGADTPKRLAEGRRILAEIEHASGRTERARVLTAENVSTAIKSIGDLSRSISYASEFRVEDVRRQLHQHFRFHHGLADPQDLFRAVQVLSLTETAKASNAIASVVKGQDPALVADWQSVVGRVKALSGMYRESLVHDPDETERLAHDLSEAKARLERLEARLAGSSAGSALLGGLTPVDAEAVLVRLGPGEALWLQAEFVDETFLFLLHDGEVKISRQPVGSSRIAELVAGVRQSLLPREDGSPRPYSYGPAHDLYSILFEPFADVLDGLEHLYLVPDGAFQSVSPNVLVVEEGVGTDRDRALSSRFLGHEVPLSVLPSPGLLAARVPEPSPDRRRVPFVGVGDPELEGGPADARGILTADAVNRVRRTVNPSILRQLFPPLPETRTEIGIFADFYGTDESVQLFGHEASETRIKTMDLGSVSVLLFATHAVVSGEFDGAFEPGLILTPPAEAESDNDGLLTASEIAELNVGADIVILSACNTAGSAARPGAEGLSGLARAFFHAGAETLLVSHWPVASDPSVFLTTGMERRYLAEPSRGRAEALRRVMLRLSRLDVAQEVWHPSIWGPFVIVGAPS